MRKQKATARRKILSAMLAIIYAAWTAQAAAGYAFNQLVPDVRQPVSLSGGSACPVRAHQLTAASSIAIRWSTTLGTSPVSILTQDQTATGRLTEIEQVISQSLAVWTAVSGATLLPATVAPLARTANQNACAPTASTPSASIKPTRPSLRPSWPSPASSPRTPSANSSAAVPRHAARPNPRRRHLFRSH